MYDLETIKLIREYRNILKPIALHELVLTKYAYILCYYPMKDSKLDIYFKLDKNQRVGMLNRHILGVASKINVYQSIIKNIILIRNRLKHYKKYIKEEIDDDYTLINKEYWQKSYNNSQNEINKQYSLLLDIISEEINRRKDIKYIRRKKMEEIEQNLQN